MSVVEQHKIFDDIARVAQLLPTPNYWLDKDAVLVGGNKHFYTILGIDENTVALDKFIHSKFPNEVTQRIIENEKEVIRSGNDSSEEEITQDILTGERRIFRVYRSPIRDENGSIVGLIGTLIETTSEKKAERLRWENEKLEIQRQQMSLQEKENFSMLARKVAHDINSPLAALKIMSERCEELPENKRSLLRSATESILDIANNLISSYQKKDNSTASESEPRKPVLVSDLLFQLLSEKKVQYQQHPVTFETEFARDAHFAFIYIQKTELRRTISNLINNAVDALDSKQGGSIIIGLTADADSVIVKVTDNGKGMSCDKVEEMLEHQSVTEGKENGHGLGLQQVWDTLEHNQGTMAIRSSLGKGTSVQLTFPRIVAPSWVAQEIRLAPDNIIVILDDDESIHNAWDIRFKPYMHSHPDLRSHHFTDGQDVLDFFNTLGKEHKDRVILLSDFELINQNKNGLQVIEESGMKNTVLVTSHHANPKIKDKVTRLGIKILPKQMASIVPILVSQG